MGRLLFILALLTLVGVIALAQTAPQPDLKITVITDHVDDSHDQVTIRFLNQSTHNLSFPRPEVRCAGYAGTILLEVLEQPPGSIYEGCDEGRDWPPPSIPELLKQAKTWVLLHPRESVDIGASVVGTLVISAASDRLHTRATFPLEQPGLYGLRAIYKGVSVTFEERQALQRAGHFVPIGDCESETVDLRVSAALVQLVNQGEYEAAYKSWMKLVDSSNEELSKNLEAQSGDAAVLDANRLASFFAQVGQFWQMRNVSDAVKFAADSASGFKQVAQLVKDGKFDEASAVLKSTQTNCAGCHEAHRVMVEESPEIK
jgi:hypothetical protein